ncbi:MAG TPA: class I adenylate-forming enzyme family protein [Gemmatimonadales bacterium]
MPLPSFRPSAFPSFPDPIRSWAAWAPDRVAVVDRGRDTRLSYAELDRVIARWTGAPARAGVRRGDRIVVLAANRTEVVALFFASCRLGACLVPLNWHFAAAEPAPILANAYKVPRRVVFLEALPRLGSGKVDRNALLGLKPNG